METRHSQMSKKQLALLCYPMNKCRFNLFASLANIKYTSHIVDYRLYTDAGVLDDLSHLP